MKEHMPSWNEWTRASWSPASIYANGDRRNQQRAGDELAYVTDRKHKQSAGKLDEAAKARLSAR